MSFCLSETFLRSFFFYQSLYLFICPFINLNSSLSFQLTKQLQPAFGPVCRIHDLEGREIETFGDLRELQSYVLCGRKQFKRMAYESIKSPREREAAALEAAAAAKVPPVMASL